jgi:glutathione S-transferase
MRVPVLVTPTGDVLTQSLAIIKYLEETHPEPPILPKDPIARAKVRAIAAIIACDIHPLNNISPMRTCSAQTWREISVVWTLLLLTEPPVTPMQGQLK